ncbi:RNI-like protein [Fomitiporia mediterranea MF3/22]|uniref:RNI-like protein n=1 Tax=Fomitiporia mediterranea (strain MF3/22) TaxID=694068 RepID=UPI0004407F54|nr:RNI-like protein [Fomitiporia mediterranea MF3/22]EJD02198.1 RNI-like protein [Fomitiporia mediterranea MF3/22]
MLNDNNDYDTPRLGRRISLQGNKGTIKYIGEVLSTQGTWLGIEWDNPDRGKHSGSKDGKQKPGSGSFIRPSPSISYGQTFLRALISKYVELPHTTGQKETVILGSSNGAIEVEAIGLDKVRGKLARLERLREISLDTEDVAFADPSGDIRKTCPNVRSLDLSNSLLSSWETVALIAAELSSLQVLSLNRNRFSELSDASNLRSAFLALEELRLNETMITWSEVIRLIPIMPNLRVLELGYNDIDRLNGSATDHHLSATKLELLNLDANKLQDWSDIMISISASTKLDRLILTSNQLQQIPQAPPEQTVVLPNIEHIGLQDNLLSEWRNLDALNVWLPNLKTLNMSGNPLFSGSIDFRQQAIVRLPSLESLNGTAISIKERTDSEIYYLSQISRNSQKSMEEREREFPRWRELCAKHGAPEEQKGTAARGRDTLAGRLISIHVHLCDSLEAEQPEDTQAGAAAAAARSARKLLTQLPPPLTLRVLPTMSIRLLKPKLLKGLRLPLDRTHQASDFTLWLVMEDDWLTKLDIEQESRDLAWWGIEDGSHLVVFTQRSDQEKALR